MMEVDDLIDEDEFELLPRLDEEMAEEEAKLCAIIWYNRCYLQLLDTGKWQDVKPEIWEGAQKCAAKYLQQYGADAFGPFDDFEWGMLNGKLSALRWVTGFDWDFLDT